MGLLSALIDVLLILPFSVLIVTLICSRKKKERGVESTYDILNPDNPHYVPLNYESQIEPKTSGKEFQGKTFLSFITNTLSKDNPTKEKKRKDNSSMSSAITQPSKTEEIKSALSKVPSKAENLKKSAGTETKTPTIQKTALTPLNDGEDIELPI